MSTKPLLSPRVPLVLGAAACAACCAFPVVAVAIGLGAGTATTIMASLEPIGAGTVAGAGSSLRAAASPKRARRWLFTLLVASCTAALGCASVGLGGALATLIALVSIGCAAWIPLALRAS